MVEMVEGRIHRAAALRRQSISLCARVPSVRAEIPGALALLPSELAIVILGEVDWGSASAAPGSARRSAGRACGAACAALCVSLFPRGTVSHTL